MEAMHIFKLTLLNYKVFCGNNEILFNPQLTVLAGKNGSGKSTILGALSKLLSWPSRRLCNIKANGIILNRKSDVSYGENGASLSLSLEDENREYTWRLNVDKKQSERSDLGMVNEWATFVQNALAENPESTSVPLFVYYPVDRAIIDIPLRIRSTHCFQKLNALDDNLQSQSRFRIFFEWFRNQEDIENEYRKENSEYRDKSLEAIRRALANFLPGYEKLTVRRSPLRMEMDKEGKTVRLDDLSDGEKCLIALVGDLARRLSMASGNLENPLEGRGIVLIDEIDLHLHPAWQRNVVCHFTRTFPNCQFIMTTHSPQILGDVPAENILLLEQEENGKIGVRIPQRSLGLSSSEVVDEMMCGKSDLALSRNERVQSELQEIYQLIDSENYVEAQEKIEGLQREVSEIPSLIEARTYLESVR